MQICNRIFPNLFAICNKWNLIALQFICNKPVIYWTMSVQEPVSLGVLLWSILSKNLRDGAEAQYENQSPSPPPSVQTQLNVWLYLGIHHMDYTLPWPPHSRPHNISAFNIWAVWLNYNIWAIWLNYNIWASCSILQYLGLMFSTSYRDVFDV